MMQFTRRWATVHGFLSGAVKVVLLAAAVMAAAEMLPYPARAAEVVLSGSTTVQSRILVPLAADIQQATGLAIKVEGVGSGNGLKRLVAAEVPAAIVSSPLAGVLATAGIADDGSFRQHDLTEDVIVPIVNARNPVKALSWEQLRDIFAGTVKNWKDVGGPDRAIQVITSHPESATRDVVWDLVMGKKVDYARSARIVYATKKEMVMVAENDGAIGAVSQGFVDAYLAETRQDGDEPEVRTVDTRTISRPLAIVTRGDPSPEVARIIAYLRTDEARRKFK